MAKGSGFNPDDVITDSGINFILMKLEKKMFHKQRRRCMYCGSPAAFQSFLMPISENKIQMYLSVDGIVGIQEIRCRNCDKTEMVSSSDVVDESQVEKRLKLRKFEVDYYYKKVEHQDIIHDLLELLHVAAISDPKTRRARHSEVTCFVMQKAMTICEEWCRAENTDLRHKKFLIMFKETMLDCDKTPDFTSDVSEEYKEMYRMLNVSFHENKRNVELLLCLLKETLFDCPSTAAFMMWSKIAMMHADQLKEFETTYRHTPELHQQTYADLMDKFLSLEIPVGLKKIPVVFILFEMPRFYHYVELYRRRCGSTKSHYSLSDDDRKSLEDIDTHMELLKREEAEKLEEEEEDAGPLFFTEDRFRRVLDDHLRKADETHIQAPAGIHVSAIPAEIQAMDKLTGVNGPEDERKYFKNVMHSVNLDPVQLTKQTMTDTHMKMDDCEVSIQSTVMTHFVKPKGSTSECTQEEIDNAKSLNKSITATKMTEIDPDTGHVKVYEKITFRFVDDEGIEEEMTLMQSEPKRSKIIGYDKKTFKLTEFGNYEIVPIERKAITSERKSSIPTSIDQLPPAIQKILEPLQEEERREAAARGKPTVHIEEVPLDTPTDEQLSNVDSKDKVENQTEKQESSQNSIVVSDETKELSVPKSTSSEHKKSNTSTTTATTATSNTATATATTTGDDSTSSAPTQSGNSEDSQIATSEPRKPRSKRPHFKYGTKWRKNKMTYDVDEVADSDSDKEEEYTFYPCKLLNEFIQSEKIVETTPRDLMPGTNTLAKFLESRDIHRSLWTIKKKYIQNELFVVLDIARESDKARLPLVSASNNRGVSVPVLPILNPTSDSSELDMTIALLYGIQVAHNKLSNKQRNVFQRYVQIAVARARHPQLFNGISLGAIKYVKENDKRVEVKLSVKDMQYEARNEEESERRKIIRLLKRAGAEQGM